jgi:hypothetical protein
MVTSKEDRPANSEAAAFDAAVLAVLDFYPAEWGGKKGIGRREAELLVTTILDAIKAGSAAEKTCSRSGAGGQVGSPEV